jgi:hypothetical protein
LAGKWVSYTTCPCSGPASSSQSGLPVFEGCSRLVVVSLLQIRMLRMGAVQCQTPSTNRPFGGPPPPRPCPLEPDICAEKMSKCWACTLIPQAAVLCVGGVSNRGSGGGEQAWNQVEAGSCDAKLGRPLFPRRCMQTAGRAGGPRRQSIQEPRRSDCNGHAAAAHGRRLTRADSRDAGRARAHAGPGWRVSTPSIPREPRVLAPSPCPIPHFSLAWHSDHNARTCPVRPRRPPWHQLHRSRAFRLEPAEPPTCCCARSKSRRRYSWASSS